MRRGVHVFGDVMLDEYVVVDVVGTYNEAPVLRASYCSRTAFPGGAANAALNCLALGSPYVALSGRIGEDAAATALRRLCCGLHDVNFASIPGGFVTAVKRRYVNSCGQMLLRVDHETPEVYHAIQPTYDKENTPVALVSDYAKGAVHEELLTLVHERAEFVVINGKPANIKRYRADCLVLNRVEAEQSVTLLGRDPRGPDGNCLWLLGLLEDACANIVVTDGANGMWWASQGGQLHHIPAVPVAVANTIGAGDTVSAVIACAGECTLSVLEAAAKHAAYVVSKPGTALPEGF